MNRFEQKLLDIIANHENNKLLNFDIDVELITDVVREAEIKLASFERGSHYVQTPNLLMEIDTEAALANDDVTKQDVNDKIVDTLEDMVKRKCLAEKPGSHRFYLPSPYQDDDRLQMRLDFPYTRLPNVYAKTTDCEMELTYSTDANCDMVLFNPDFKIRLHSDLGLGAIADQLFECADLVKDPAVSEICDKLARVMDRVNVRVMEDVMKSRNNRGQER